MQRTPSEARGVHSLVLRHMSLCTKSKQEIGVGCTRLLHTHKSEKGGQMVVMHTCNPNTWEAEASIVSVSLLHERLINYRDTLSR